MKNEIFSIIQQFTGQRNILTLNVSFIDFTGSLESALFLSQLLYWQERATIQGEWVAKSHPEWYSEIRIKRHALENTRAKLEEAGILETKKRHFNGVPTMHYRIKKDAFVKEFTAFLRNLNAEKGVSIC